MVTAATLAVAAIIFGLKMRNQYDVSDGEVFGWAYFVAIGAAVSATVTSCILASTLCSKYHKKWNKKLSNDVFKRTTSVPYTQVNKNYLAWPSSILWLGVRVLYYYCKEVWYHNYD